jgi:hypothetical protein
MHIVILCGIVCSALPSAGAAPVSLVRDGQPQCAIVQSPMPSPAEKLAANELACYLQQITGATVPIEMGVKSDRTNIVLHQQSDEDSDLTPIGRRLPAEGFGIAVRKNNVFLVGGDERGVLYAAYTFLERLGCRWLAPKLAFYKGSAEVVPHLSMLTFSLDKDLVQAPVLKFRKLYVEEGHSHNAENLQQMVEWMPKLRYNTLVVPIDYSGRGRVKWDNWREALTPELKRRGIIIEVGGHGYQNFLNAEQEGGKYWREHPGWFGSDESGKRTPAQNRVICSSNAGAVEHLQAGVLAYLKTHAEIQIFDFWPPDGAKWCTCEACQALGSPSQRHALLVARVSQAVRKELPKVRLECIAYSSYVDPPPKVSFDESVLVDFCPIGQSFEYQIDDPASDPNAKYAANLKAWAEKFKGDVSIYSYYRKYAWDSLPIVIPHYMQNDLRWYRQVGAHGVSTYAEPGDWFTYELNHYTLGRLAWDPDADVDAVMQEFCTARYGSAAEAARKVFATMEDVTRKACSIPGTSLKKPADYAQFAAKIDECRKTVKAAADANRADDASQAHLGRLTLTLDYAAEDIALQKERAAEGDPAARKAAVDKLLTFLQAHAEDGVFVVSGTRLDPARAYKRYGVPGKASRRTG